MTLVTELDLPAFDYTAPDFAADRYHRQLAEVRAQGWLARSPLAYLVLDREAGEFFLRSRAAAFPGREIAEFFGITAGPLWDHIDTNILNLAGEKHRRLRALVGPAFTPRAADRWRPVMRDLLAQRWDTVAPATACEFMGAVARPYPALTIAAVLGAPAADAERLQQWSNLVQRQFDISALATQGPDIERAVAEVSDYAAGLLAERRRQPRDDLASALLAAEDDGQRLSHAECVNLVVNVLAGAIDTTQSQLGHALRLFAAHPDQWARLAADPGLVPRAVQEVLRFEPITPFTARICREGIEYRGVGFPAGTIVAVCAERGNREGGGEEFDIGAEREARLLTFGAGAHFCLGANLARAELEEALRFLAPRMPGLAADGDPELGGVEGIYGVDRLPLRWTAAGGPRCVI
ncbi:MAG: cytochrome P450 [Actinobacteria bacterium]|nr:cytochrome P450 [Actinomycetota bacterium]